MLLSGNLRREVKYAVGLFILFASFRAILEYFAGSFPLGNDSVESYEVWIRTGQPIEFVSALVQSILYSLNDLVRNPSLTVKVVMILLQGALASSLFFWLHSITKNPKVAFFASLATCFYFPVLRITWDLMDNVLALVFGFACLALIGSPGRKRYALANVLLILSVLSDIVTLPVLIFVIIFRKDSPVRRLIPVIISASMFVAAVAFSPETLGLQRLALSLVPSPFGYQTLAGGGTFFVLYLAAAFILNS